MEDRDALGQRAGDTTASVSQDCLCAGCGDDIIVGITPT